MTSIANGELGNSVRSKLNSSLAVTDALTVNNGNVGIGVTPSVWYQAASPYKAVQLGITGSIFGRTGNEQVNMASNAYASGSATFTYLASGNAASMYQQDAGAHRWSTAPSGTSGNPITFSVAMTLNENGNLGVGTISANAASIVDAQSTTKGVRFPNMTTVQKVAIANVAGNVVFDTTLGKLCVNSGSGWQTITSV